MLAYNVSAQQLDASFGNDGILVFDATELTEESVYGSLLDGIRKSFFINDKFYFLQDNKVIAFNLEGKLDSEFNEVGVLELDNGLVIVSGFAGDSGLSFYGCVRNQNQLDFVFLNLNLSASLEVTQELFLTDPQTQIEPINHFQAFQQSQYVFGRKSAFGGISTIPDNGSSSAAFVAKFEDSSNPNINESNVFFFEEIERMIYFQELGNSKYRLFFLHSDNPVTLGSFVNYVEFDIDQTYPANWFIENKVRLGVLNKYGMSNILSLNNQKSLIVWTENYVSGKIDGLSVWNSTNNELENFYLSEIVGDYEISTIHAIGEKILFTGNKLVPNAASVPSLIMLDKDLKLDSNFGDNGVFDIPPNQYEFLRSAQKPILKNNDLIWFGEGFYFGETNDLLPDVIYPLDYHDIAIQIEFNETSNIEVVENALVVYPTITNDIIYFSGVEVQEINVYNQSGKLCLRNLSSVDLLDVSNLPPGIYFLSVTDAKNKIQTQRFVKH